MRSEREVGDWNSPDQVLLDDPFEHLGRAGVIPDAFGVNHRNGAPRADVKAVDLAALHPRGRSGKAEFLQSRLEVFPGFKSELPRAALWFGLICAQENVMPIRAQTEALNCFVEVRVHL